ncbi:MAG: hypothetical protein JOZ52_01565 [Acidobacteria bacterium]|nr:hypothetical protein [Acidobacteriota bacterium]
MKKQMFKFFAMIILVIMIAFVSALASASAQSPGHNLTASVPFEFSVGDKAMPAGDYSIGRLNSDGAALRISNQESNKSVSRLTQDVQASQPKATSLLVFRRYGDQYFLAQVWLVGEKTGREFSKTDREKSLESEIAKNNTEMETVTVIAQLH